MPNADTLPSDWTVYDQHRMETLDRELQNALRTVRRSVVAAKAVKARFMAMGLSGRWPTDVADAVHQEASASTRQEQVDASALIDFLCDKLLDDGTASGLTDAQAANFLARYAG